MIRTLAVLAGGFLGFAAALMVANSSPLEPVDLASNGGRPGYFSEGAAYAEFEGELGLPAKRVPYEPFDDTWLSNDVAESSGQSGKGAVKRTGPAPVDRASDLYRLQFELARLDCFEGQLNGQWSLAFHDSLASLALTRELDFKALGSVEAVIGTLRSYNAGVCAKVDVVAQAEQATDSVTQWPELLMVPVANVRRHFFDAADLVVQPKEPAVLEKPRDAEPVHEHRQTAIAIVGSEDTPAVDRPAIDEQELIAAIRDTKVAPVNVDRDADDAVARNRAFVFPKLDGRHTEKFAEAVPQVAEIVEPDVVEIALSVPVDEPVSEVAVPDVAVSTGVDRIVDNGALLETSQVDAPVDVVATSVASAEPDAFDLPAPVRANEPEPTRQVVALPSEGVEQSWSLAAKVDVPVRDIAVREDMLRHDLSDGFPEQLSVSIESGKNGQLSRSDTVISVPLPTRRTEALLHVFGVAALPEKNRTRTVTTSRTRPKRKAVRAARKTARVAKKATVVKKKTKPKKVAKRAWKNNRKAIFNSRD